MTKKKENDFKVEKMVIDFQDFFENDTVTIQLNNCALFENKILNSDEVIGYTRVRLSVDNLNRIFIGTTVVNIDCSVNVLQKSIITVILNGNENIFKIDLSNGIYIGFDKKNNNHLYITQSKKPFEYD